MKRTPVKIPIYQVDAFTDAVFGGNPAAVCPLTEWLPDALMLQIAQENNLSEMGFNKILHNSMYCPLDSLLHSYTFDTNFRS